MNNQKEIKKYSTLLVQLLIFVGIAILIYLSAANVVRVDTSKITLFILYLFVPLVCGSVGLFFRFKPRQTTGFIEILKQIISGLLAALIILGYILFIFASIFSWVT